MNEEECWTLIDSVHREHGPDMDGKSAAIRQAVAQLAVEDATDFAHFFDGAMDGAYSHALWGAAYLVNGGCSDDAFMDFRASLISRGREHYKAAVSEPDRLAEGDFDEDAWFYEGYQYAVTDGVEQAVGSVVARSRPHPAEPAGESWEESDEFFQRAYPELWSRFGVREQAPSPKPPPKKRPWWKFW